MNYHRWIQLLTTSCWLHYCKHHVVTSDHTCTAFRKTCWLFLTYCIASRSQRVSLIVIPFCLSVCLSGCLSVIPWPTAYHDWSITTKFGRQVYTCPWTRVSLFRSPISHTFGSRWKNISNTSTVGNAKPYSSYSSWLSLLIFGHNTLHRHTHRLTSAFLICAVMSKWQPFNAYSCHCKRDALCHMTCLLYGHSHLLIATDLKANDQCNDRQQRQDAGPWWPHLHPLDNWSPSGHVLEAHPPDNTPLPWQAGVPLEPELHWPMHWGWPDDGPPICAMHWMMGTDSM